MRGSSSLALLDQLGQLRDDLVHVADDAEVAEFEDRRVRVLVDRDDHVRALHADLVLDRAADAERDVQLRRDDLAGLADLRAVGVPAGVDDRARRADRAAERLRELFRQREVLGCAEATAAGDDDVGVLDRRADLLLRLLADDLRGGTVRLELRLDLLDLRLAAARRGGVEAAGAEERDPRRRRPPDVDVDGVLQRRALAGEVAREVDEIPVEAGVEACGEAGRDIGGEHRVREQDGFVAVLLHDLREHVDARLRECLLELFCLGDENLPGAELARFARERLRVLADDDGGDVCVAEGGRLREDAERALLELVAVLLEEDEDARTRRFSTRKSRIAWALSPPESSTLRASPRDGGSLSAATVVRLPCSPACAASTPRSASVSVSNGFFFAPMIPLSEG